MALSFAAIPIIFIVTDFFYFGRQWDSLDDDVHVTFFRWAQLLLDGSPVQLFRHMPGTPMIEFFVIFAAIGEITEITYEDMNRIGLIVYVLALIVAAAIISKFNDELKLSSVEMAVLAIWVFSMPNMLRYMTMFSIYYLFGLLMLLSGVIFCAVYKSDFRKHWNKLFFVFGVAITFLYLAVIPFLAVCVVYLWRVYRGGKAVIREDAGLSRHPVLHVAAFVAAILLASGFVGIVLNLFHPHVASMKFVLITSSVLSIILALAISRMNVLQVAKSCAIALSVQVFAFGASYYTSGSISELKYTPSIVAAFPTVLIALSLWQLPWFKDMAAGPFGFYALGVGVVGNIYTPFYAYGVLVALGHYSDTHSAFTVNSEFWNLVVRNSWNASIVAVVAVGVGVVFFRRAASEYLQEKSSEILFYLMMSGILVVATILPVYDLLISRSYEILLFGPDYLPTGDGPLETPTFFGIRSRYLLPLLFTIPIIMMAIHACGTKIKVTALAVLVTVSVLSVSEYIVVAVPAFKNAF